jgi:hypothetical protein
MHDKFLNMIKVHNFPANVDNEVISSFIAFINQVYKTKQNSYFFVHNYQFCVLLKLRFFSIIIILRVVFDGGLESQLSKFVIKVIFSIINKMVKNHHLISLNSFALVSAKMRDHIIEETSLNRVGFNLLHTEFKQVQKTPTDIFLK